MEGDVQVITRIIRYQKGEPRVAIRYRFLDESENMSVFTESDWAGEEVTMKTPAGCGVQRQPHH